MNEPRAIQIAEGGLRVSKQEYREAFQYLASSGIVWQLGGAVTAKAQELLEAGVITTPYQGLFDGKGEEKTE